MFWRAAVVAAGAVLATASMASAQVTVNPGALELLPRAPAARAPAGPAPTQRQQAHPAPRPPPGRSPATRPAPVTPPAPPGPPPKPPTVPVTPPEILALPPPIQVPVARPPPIPVVPVAPDAPGAVQKLPNGLRVTFGPDRSDLNPATETALRSFARAVRPNDQATVNIYAYAAGSADDPSTTRRLSLARALAARAVLINEGIPSTRIYPRALGGAGGDIDRDRVDVVSGPPGPPTAQTAPDPLTTDAPSLAPPPAPPAAAPR